MFNPFLEGKILLINKPYQWTSFDVVNKIRNAISKKIGIKKIKVGHAGTLDPLATGLLIICTGKATKKISELQGLEKCYSATIKLGGSTPSFDRETDINKSISIENISNSDILKVADSFLGDQEQYPPIFSAIKIRGEKLYNKARRGEKIKLKPRQIRIKTFKIINTNLPLIKCKICCSKGTYIRSIANDFGIKLNNVAHLYDLKRDSIGCYKLENATSLEDFLNKLY